LGGCISVLAGGTSRRPARHVTAWCVTAGTMTAAATGTWRWRGAGCRATGLRSTRGSRTPCCKCRARARQRWTKVGSPTVCCQLPEARTEQSD
jgi:hypothetical protein